jgi:hypothetical protein
MPLRRNRPAAAQYKNIGKSRDAEVEADFMDRID